MNDEDFKVKMAKNMEFRSNQIPDIDLYMDQIIGLFNQYFASENGDEERLLTKTMIHNYSKEGLIKPVKGKKYSKEHIMQMLSIYHLKNTLKISEIKEVLQQVYAWPDYTETYLEESFDRYMESKAESNQKALALFEELAADHCLNIDKQQDLMVLLFNAASLSYYFKCICEEVAAKIKAVE